MNKNYFFDVEKSKNPSIQKEKIEDLKGDYKSAKNYLSSNINTIDSEILENLVKIQDNRETNKPDHNFKNKP